MPQLKLKDASLYYEVYGQGEPLIFLHGSGANSLFWWQQVDFFAARYQCILPDLRGFGRSRGTVDCFTAYERDLQSVLHALKIDGFSAIGHSMGGAVLGSFCQTFPGRVRAAIFSCSHGALQLSAPLNALLPTALSQLPASIRSWKKGDRHHPVLSARFSREQPALARLFVWLAALNPPFLPGPGVPEPSVSPQSLPPHTLFVTGAEDEVVPPEVVRGAAAATPNSRFEVIPNCGHSPFFEQAVLFNRIVDEFLQREEQAGRRTEH